MPYRTIERAAEALVSGNITSQALIDASFARIHDPDGEGARTFIRLFEEAARGTAQKWDMARLAGEPLPALAGIPISVKDLCDIELSRTTAGSIALADHPPATVDALLVKRLRTAGAIILGTTNMTEFAMGTLGLNPHYGTPRNPYKRAAGYVPGGSSSGAAISVADGMALAAIGSDTAGSIRVPAAFCGVVGFKPTARRVPSNGTIPLAPSLDSLGPLALSVDCCALLDAVLTDEPVKKLPVLSLSGLRLAIPMSLVLDGMSTDVSRAFYASLTILSNAGADIIEIPFQELLEFPALNVAGGFSVIEGYAWHKTLLTEKQSVYDPIIGRRFLSGARATAVDYIEMVNLRLSLIERCHAVTKEFDAIVMPTVPIAPPRIAEFLHNEELWLATNRLLTRNPVIANVLDRCAISIPCHAVGAVPVGLTLMGECMRDRRLLEIANAVERALKRKLLR